MLELLDVFITPYDRESIYRIIDQLDWMALSVKHLATDLLIYQVMPPENYTPVFTLLKQMANAIAEGFVFLTHKNLNGIVRIVNEISAFLFIIPTRARFSSQAFLNRQDMERGFNDRIRIEADRINASINQKFCHLRIVGWRLSAKAGMSFIAFGAIDGQAYHFLDTRITLIKIKSNDIRISIHTQSQLSQVIRTDGKTIE